MTTKDTFNGAKNAYIEFFAYINTVAQEMGQERAFALKSKTSEVMGAMQGQMMKAQACPAACDVKDAALLAQEAIKELGICSETVVESPQEVVFKVAQCPLYEAAQALGLDAETIETLCRAGAIRFMDATVKQLNPNLHYQLRKFRVAADDCCEEAIVLEVENIQPRDHQPYPFWR